MSKTSDTSTNQSPLLSSRMVFQVRISRLIKKMRPIKCFNSADDPRQVIINAARRLDHSGVALNQLGIQFAQIGDEEDATEALQELDEGIAAVNGIRVRSYAHLLVNDTDIDYRTWWTPLHSILTIPNSQPLQWLRSFLGLQMASPMLLQSANPVSRLLVLGIFETTTSLMLVNQQEATFVRYTIHLRLMGRNMRYKNGWRKCNYSAVGGRY